MPRIPNTNTRTNGADPYHGNSDADSDEEDFFDQLHAMLEEVGDDHVLTFVGAMKSFQLLPSGRGIEVKFEMGLEQRDKLSLLTLLVQRLVRVDVTRYKRGRDDDV